MLVLLAAGGGAGAAGPGATRNCGKIAILPVLDEPFRKIVRVSRPKL